MNSEIFWIDDYIITYEKFYKDLVKKNTNSVYIKEKNSYKVFLMLLRNALCEKKTILLDSDFSEKELNAIDVKENEILNKNYVQDDISDRFKSFQEVLDYLKQNNEKLKVDIFTSGTTGRPKKITQSFKLLTQGVKSNFKYKNDVWGFSYNPTHFAGLQVFFQALFNKNQIVYLFGKDFSIISKLIIERKITNISCTPSFIKMLLPHINSEIPSLLRITTGGEKIDSHTQQKIKLKFPKAIIRNIYASTEAGSLLVSDGNYFTIPDRYCNTIKIIENEIVIHSSLMGESTSLVLKDDWYYSGDLVKFIDKKRFIFVSRKSEMINVGGYKVNPNEVESIISSIKGVKQVKVIPKKNSVLGNLIGAEVELEEGFEKKIIKEEILKKCKDNLQDFKVPRIIKFVDGFSHTRTGKLKR